MGTYISQFNLATLLLNTDLVAGLRGTTPNQTDYKFPIIGIGDSLGSPIIAWTQGAGTMLSPNINSINFQNNVAGSAPIISTLSSGLTPDTSVNLNIGAFGPLGYVQFTGTNAIAIPAGTAAQAPVTFVGGGIRYNTTSQYLGYWSTVSNSWVDLTTGSALSNLTFVTNTNETAFAPNSQALSSLSTGIAYVTTTTGIVGTRTLTGTANEITVSNGTGSVGNPTFSIPSTFIAPGTITAVTSVSAPAYLLTGSGSGTISILPQAAAGTFNFNLPITAGTSGYVLTSGGGGASPMTWANLSSATVTSISGTANEITASASTGAVTLSIPSTFIAPGSIAATTTVSGTTFNSSTLTASQSVQSDGSNNLVSLANTGSGNNVLATSPTLVTPILGTPTSGTLTNCTGYPGSALTGTSIPTAIQLSVNNYNSGSGASAATFLAGDGTWKATSGSGAYVLIGTQSASGSANVQFTALSSTYAAYKVIFRNVVTSTNNEALYLQVSTDNGSTWVAGTNYFFVGNASRGGSSPDNSAFGNGNTGVSVIQLVNNTSNTAQQGIFGELTFFGAGQSTFYQQVTWQASSFNAPGGWWQNNTGQGAVVAAEVVNAIQFYSSSGNLATGDFYLYGLVA